MPTCRSLAWVWAEAGILRTGPWLQAGGESLGAWPRWGGKPVLSKVSGLGPGEEGA